jgi:hypothetical protein
MAKPPMICRIGAGCAAVAATLVMSCSMYPTDASGGRALMELESVWQYLKAYSIWQDSVPLPPTAFTYNTPEQLFKSVNDTLHGVPYTGYDSSSGYVSSGRANCAAAIDSVPPIYYTAISPRTAYLRIIKEFRRDTTFDSFLVALPFLSRYSNIMLDLRGNGGGDLAALDSIIGYFLPVNTPYIVATYRAYDGNARTASTIRDERWTIKSVRSPSLSGKNIVILLNRGSASASEILAAGIKDGRASQGLTACRFVGDTSYGKGIGQVLVSRRQFHRQDVKITFLRVFRACGCADSVYHRKGLAPDIRVTNSDAAVADSLQLLAAFHVLEPGVMLKKSINHFAQKQFAGIIDIVAPEIPDFEK